MSPVSESGRTACFILEEDSLPSEGTVSDKRARKCSKHGACVKVESLRGALAALIFHATLCFLGVCMPFLLSKRLEKAGNVCLLIARAKRTAHCQTDYLLLLI